MLYTPLGEFFKGQIRGHWPPLHVSHNVEKEASKKKQKDVGSSLRFPTGIISEVMISGPFYIKSGYFLNHEITPSWLQLTISYLGISGPGADFKFQPNQTFFDRGARKFLCSRNEYNNPACNKSWCPQPAANEYRE